MIYVQIWHVLYIVLIFDGLSKSCTYILSCQLQIQVPNFSCQLKKANVYSYSQEKRYLKIPERTEFLLFVNNQSGGSSVFFVLLSNSHFYSAISSFSQSQHRNCQVLTKVIHFSCCTKPMLKNTHSTLYNIPPPLSENQLCISMTSSRQGTC